jgi:hypothetical protein
MSQTRRSMLRGSTKTKAKSGIQSRQKLRRQHHHRLFKKRIPPHRCQPSPTMPVTVMSLLLNQPISPYEGYRGALTPRRQTTERTESCWYGRCGSTCGSASDEKFGFVATYQGTQCARRPHSQGRPQTRAAGKKKKREIGEGVGGSCRLGR